MSAFRDSAGLDHDTFLESVIMRLKEGIVVSDSDGHLLMLNESARRFFGVGATEAAPNDWSEVSGICLPDTDTPYPLDQLPMIRALRGDAIEDEELFVRGYESSEGIWLGINCTPLSDENDQVIGCIFVFRPLTQRNDLTP